MELTKDKIAGYYPYDLKVLEIFDINKSQIRNVIALSTTFITTDLQRFPYTQEISFGSFKLILHPLSDFTKEIEINGKKFVPIDLLNEQFNENIEFNGEMFIELSAKKQYGIMWLSYILIQKLYKWHFDIHGLIENNLAIDVNTLETNPYK